MSNSGKRRLWGFEVKAFALLESIILLSLNITELITMCELSVHYVGLLATFSKRFCFSESKSVCERKKIVGVYHLSGFVISL